MFLNVKFFMFTLKEFKYIIWLYYLQRLLTTIEDN